MSGSEITIRITRIKFADNGDPIAVRRSTYPVLMPIDNDVDALRSVFGSKPIEDTRRRSNGLSKSKRTGQSRSGRGHVGRYVPARRRKSGAAAGFNRRQHVPNWESKLKTFSALFKKYPEIYDATLSLSANADNDYLVNSEGTSIEHGRSSWRLSIYARTKADDGMELYRFEAFDSHTSDRLPSDEKIRQTIETMVTDLKALRAAPVIEPFTGPAILSGRASGVFFHEIFGHRIEGHRQKSESEGQTFTKKVNQSILPDFISVVDDPTTERLNGVDLNGYYKFDDDGVAARTSQRRR